MILISTFDNDFDFDFNFEFKNENEIEDDSLKYLYNSYIEELNSRDDNDYELNWVQWRKLVAVVALLKELSGEFDEVFPVEIKPSYEVGNVIAKFVTLSVRGEDVKRFCKALSFASVIGFDIIDDMIQVEIVIPKVFIRR